MTDMSLQLIAGASQYVDDPTPPGPPPPPPGRAPSETSPRTEADQLLLSHPAGQTSPGASVAFGAGQNPYQATSAHAGGFQTNTDGDVVELSQAARQVIGG